jgi:hypothetical protein
LELGRCQCQHYNKVKKSNSQLTDTTRIFRFCNISTADDESLAEAWFFKSSVEDDSHYLEGHGKSGSCSSRKVLLYQRRLKRAGAVFVAHEVPQSPSRHIEPTVMFNQLFQPSTTTDGVQIVNGVRQRHYIGFNHTPTLNKFRETKTRLKHETGTNKIKPSNDLKIPVPDPSPWMILKSSRTSSAGDSSSPSTSHTEESSPQKQKDATLELRS